MPSKKKTTSKKSKKPELCLRHIDKTTVQMSDNPEFPTYDPEGSNAVPKGMKRYDASTVLPAK